MKTVAGIVIGILVGFLLGGLSPRRETADWRKKNAALEKELDEARRKSGRGSSRFVPIPGFDELPRGSITRNSTPEPGDSPGDGAASPTPEPAATFSEEDLRTFQLAVDAQRMRAKQTRAALAEQARLSQKEIETIDAVVAKMNAELQKHANDLIDMVESMEEPDPRELLRVSHELTGILYDSQTAYEAAIGEEDFGGLDESTRQVWNLVDLEIFRDALGGGQGTP